ncbi:MAG: hypothetical protein SNG02_01405 [Rikenellaceae bacterium]
MGPTRAKIENPFEGRWDVISSEYYNIKSGKWEPYNTFGEGELWLEFSPISVVETGRISMVEGQLHEHHKGHKTIDTTYRYDAKGDLLELIIDRSIYLEDGFLDEANEETIYVEEAPKSRDNQRSLYLNHTSTPSSPRPEFRITIVYNM